MLIKDVVVGVVSVLEDKQMEVREDTIVYEDLKELSRTYMRYTVSPGEDISDKPKIVQDLAGLLWTPEAIEKWQAIVEKNKPKVPSGL